MRFTVSFASLSVVVYSLAMARSEQAQPEQTDLPQVVIATTAGQITVAVDLVKAPVTSKNFLRYVDAGLYDRGNFYRVVTTGNQDDKPVKIQVIQGGVAGDKHSQTYEPIGLETTRTTGLHHLAGTVSMARGDPNSATSEFFICLRDEPELDFGGRRNPDGQGFAAFGQVIAGMDVVKKIHQSKAQGQALTPKIEIVSLKRK